MNLNKIKKILSIVSIVSLVIGVIVPILALFSVVKLDFGKGDANFPSMLMLSMFVICAASFFSVSAINVIKANKVLSFVALGLIVVTTICALLIFTLKFNVSEIFTKLLAVIGVFTVLFVIVISTYLKLQKSYLALQIVLYVLVFALDVIITASVFGAKWFDNETFTKIFVVFCIVVFVLLCTTSIIGRKVSKEVSEDNVEYVTITKQEYEELKEKANKYDALNNN